MSDTYIDVAGLARTPARAEQVAEALGLDGERVGLAGRVSLLRRLRRSAGVTVYTGPAGAAFWLPASVEVKVRIVPDDVDLTTRLPADMGWALQAGGLTATEAGQLVTTPPKTVRHARWEAWREAESLLAAVVAPGQEEPIVHTVFEAELVYVEGGEAQRLLDHLTDAGLDDGTMVSLDYEWDVEDYEPEGLGIATADRNWYVPIEALDYHAPTGHGQVLRDAVALLLRNKVPNVWHNGKADLQTQYPGDPAELAGLPIDDTIVMAYIAGDAVLGLKPLTRARLGRDAMNWPGTMRNLPLETAKRYAGAGDARNTYDLRENLLGVLAMRDPHDVYGEIERPVMPIIASMEKYGQPVDPDALSSLHQAFFAMAEGIRQMWWARERLDISDDKQLRVLIQRRTGYDPGSVAVDVLARTPDQWMDSIIGYRRIRHRDRSFLVRHMQRWDAAGRPDDFRAYSSFNQAGTADEMDGRSFRRAPKSGRLSSSSSRRRKRDGSEVDVGFGNLQNQPGGEASIKSAFVAPPGHVLVAQDYSALEMIIAATQSQDPVMLARLRAGVDMHTAFADDIFNRTGKRLVRPAAKRGNFNAQYGGYADTLGKSLRKERIDLPREDLISVVETHRSTYAGYYGYADDVVAEAQANGGFSETLMGRRRYDPDMQSFDRTAQGHAERALVNHTIQGTAADILKRAMALTNPVARAYGAHLSLQVHDELVWWCPEDTAEAFSQTVAALMESIPVPGLRLRVAGGVGRTWEDAK